MNYELDTYLDALQFFPNDADMLELARGRAFLVKKDIFRNLMWYTLADSNKQYPLTLETVKKIRAQNKEGIKPEALETAEVITGKPKEIEPEYADLVGQISLKSLEKTTRKRREKERGQQQQQRGPQQQGGNPNRGPQQQGGQPRQQNQPNQPGRQGQQRGPQQGGNPNRGPQQGGQGGQQRQQPRPPQRGPQKPPSA